MSDNKTGRGSDQFPLRLPDGMREALKLAADDNGRSMNSEIVARLQYSFDVRTMARQAVLDDAIAEFKAATEKQHEVLRWLQEQQSVTMHMLETIANTDGNLKPEFMEMLRGMLSRRGADTDFPEPTAERPKV